MTKTELRKLVGHVFTMENCVDHVLVHAHPYKDSFDFLRVDKELNEVNLDTHGVNYNEYGVSLYLKYKGKNET